MLKTRFSFSTLFILCLLVSSPDQINAQICDSCFIHVTGIDTSSYTVASGQRLCIDSSAVFEGTVVLSGGDVCNSGVFKPKNFTFTTGTVINNAVLILSNSFNLPSGSSVFNNSTGVVTCRIDLGINGGSINNSGILNVRNTITCNSGAMVNSAVVNCRVLLGSGLNGVTNTGIINED